jgi:hypothetical protein
MSSRGRRFAGTTKSASAERIRGVAVERNVVDWVLGKGESRIEDAPATFAELMNPPAVDTPRIRAQLTQQTTTHTWIANPQPVKPR